MAKACSQEVLLMKIAAAYIRVSTDDQIEYSPDSQRKAILDYAKRNDYIVPQEYIFVDEGISGRSTKRPAFQQMIGTAKQKSHPFDAILVWKFSRFARNREDSVVYKSMLRKQCGVEVISISEQIGEDKTSILIEALLEAMDEYYSINLAEEVVRGMTEKARRGGSLGGAPFGYKVVDGKMIPDEYAAPIVQWVFQQFLNGMGMRKIATMLNERDIRTKYGNPWENRTIDYMLHNIAYIGHQHWTPGGTRENTHAEKLTQDTIVVENVHPAIIEKGVFQAAQDRCAQLKAKYKKSEKKETGIPFLAKGLVHCSACGRALCLSVKTKGVQCQGYAKGKCTESHYISLRSLDALILSQIQHDVETGNFGTALQKAHSNASPKKKNIQTAIDRTQRKLARVREAYEAGIDTLDEYRIRKKQLQAELETLQKQLESAPESKKFIDITEELKKKVQSGVSILTSDVPDELKNSVLHSFVNQIIFDRKNTSVSISYYML